MNHARKPFYSLFNALCVAGIASVTASTAVHAQTPAPVAKPGYVETKMVHETYGAMLIVVPITTDDKTIQSMKLRNLENSLDATEKWGGQMQSTVVLYSKGVSLPNNPDPETKKKIDALKARGVQFNICDNTLREQGISFHKLYQVVDRDIVPSGFAEVAYLQSKKNYVVDPIN